jgi:hypothetical protein
VGSTYSPEEATVKEAKQLNTVYYLFSICFITDFHHIFVQVEAGELYLTCSADGRPTDFSYSWEWDNTTLLPEPPAHRLRLERAASASGGHFSCLVNNSLGYGEPCSLVVEPEPGYLLLALSHTDALAAVLGTGSLRQSMLNLPHSFSRSLQNRSLTVIFCRTLYLLSM